jgi:hypothetical protein
MTVRGLQLRVTHRFTRNFIQTRWDAVRRSGNGRYTADALFPSTGGKAASVVAVLRNGTTVNVGTRPIPLSTVRYLWVRSQHSGYVVVPVTVPKGAGLHTIRAAAQTSQPNPGPTAAIQIARAKKFSRTALTVRLTPVHNEQEAAAEAARLS